MASPVTTDSVTYVSSTSPVVLLTYAQISDPTCDLSKSIEAAYGENGLGILVIRGIPTFEEKRIALLPLARSFASLPDSVKSSYEHPASHYNFGWSHGKEQLVGGIPDYGKGSFYANPVHDSPFAKEPEMEKKYPSFCSPNIWPQKELPALEVSFKSLGSLVVSVGTQLAKHVDKYIARRVPDYPKDTLERIVRESRNPKARLLHYYPADDPSVPKPTESKGKEVDKTDEFGSWCGWHNDHGSLTGLTSALFIDAEGKAIGPPGDNSGLYIKSRKGDIVKATIPTDCLAFQIGETHQILSGGHVQATPHAVKSSSLPGTSRETFAVFMEPEIGEPMVTPKGTDRAGVISGTAIKYLPPGIPPLGVRWDDGITFGEFTNRTLDAYHPSNDNTKLIK